VFLDYAILGDDVVIANSEVANIYKQIITSLGVKISLQKCVEPENVITKEGDSSSLEFASIYMTDGVNFEMMPLGLILNPTAHRVIAI
jgi:hypothetical protein